MKFREIAMVGMIFASILFSSPQIQAQNATAPKQAAPAAAAPAQPQLTDARKIEILKQQRTVLDEEARMRDIGSQYQALLKQHADDSQVLDDLIAAENKRAGATWQLRPDTLEFVPVPTAVSTAPAPVIQPAEKKK